MPVRYVPDAGDVVWLQFDPQAGHEHVGRRLALVLSPSQYNEKTGLMLCCPLTNQVKGYPFEVAIADARKGVALADQLKSLDWKARKAKLRGKATRAELSEVRRKSIALIGEP